MQTLNKDGKPRKTGSGRRKGGVSNVSIKLIELKKHFKDDDIIVVNSPFLQKAGVTPLGKAISKPLSAQAQAGIRLYDV